MCRLLRFLYATLLLAVLLAVSLPVTAAPPAPTYGTAVVDGQYAEWTLAADYYADMYLSGDPAEPAEAKTYLRYDNARGILYALILCGPVVTGYVGQSADAWIVLDFESPAAVVQTSGEDGNPPDFAWVAQGYDGNPLHVRGYEASFRMLPGDHAIVAQVGILDPADGTAAVAALPASGAQISVPVAPIGVKEASFGSIMALYR